MNTKFIFQSLMLIFLSVITLFCSRNPPSTPVPVPGEIYVNDFGATPNDTTDDTKAFQQAIDSVYSLGGGTVKARPGVYLINPDISIQMRSNVTLDLEDQNRVLQAKTSLLHRYEIIQVWDAINVTIKNGLIIGDLKTHVMDQCDSVGRCEQGFGIEIRRSKNTTVQGSHIKHCWGDGIVVAGNKITPSQNTMIDLVVCDSNRRQGLTIGGGVSGVTVTKSHFTNTGQYKGTKPMDGIDIEPDCNTAENIKILDCTFARNGELCVEKRGANGIEMNAIQTESRKRFCVDSAGQDVPMIRDVEISGCRITTSNYPVYIQNSSEVKVTDNTFDSTRFRLKEVNCDSCVFERNTWKNRYTCNTTQ